MKKRIVRGLRVLVILGILILSSTASACVHSTDSFATEVLLNKPGVSYNLSGMIESDDVIIKTREIPVGIPDMPEPQMGALYRNVTTIDSSGVVGSVMVIDQNVTTIDSESVETRTELDRIIYRSHHNPNVAAILSEDQILINGGWTDDKYLSVRIQVPTKDVHRSMPIVEIELTGNRSIADIDLNASAEYGWTVIECERKGACTLEKDNIQIDINSDWKYPAYLDDEAWNMSPEERKRMKERYQEMVLRGEITLTTNVSIAITNAETLEVRNVADDERCNWQPPGVDVLGLCEMEVGYYYDKRYGCICLSGCVTPAGIPFDSSEECEAVCGRDDGDKIAEVLVAIGFFDDREEALSEISNWEQRTSEWDDLEPAIDTSGFDYVTALIVELDWLSKNGVIENLTERDIHGMCKVAHQGTAGFNSRVVYEEGAWLQYSETNNLPLLRDIDCSGFSITELPDGIISYMSAPSHTSSTSIESDRAFTYAMPAFTALAAIVGVLAVARIRRRKK